MAKVSCRACGHDPVRARCGKTDAAAEAACEAADKASLRKRRRDRDGSAPARYAAERYNFGEALELATQTPSRRGAGFLTDLEKNLQILHPICCTGQTAAAV